MLIAINPIKPIKSMSCYVFVVYLFVSVQRKKEREIGQIEEEQQVLPPGSDHLIDYFPILHQYECWHCLHSIFLCNILRCDPYFFNTSCTETKQNKDKTRLKAHTINSSTSILMNSTSMNLAANSLTIGSICRQGPHHAAVKSITIYTKPSTTTNHNTKLNQLTAACPQQNQNITLLYVGIESSYETYKLVCFLCGFKTSCPLSFVVTLHNDWSLWLYCCIGRS